MPTTKEEIIRVANEMLEKAFEEAKKNIDIAINSGGIDIYEDNCLVLGKVVAKAAINEGVYQFLTLSPKNEKSVKNLNKLM